jgi:hypothetical protein
MHEMKLQPLNIFSPDSERGQSSGRAMRTGERRSYCSQARTIELFCCDDGSGGNEISSAPARLAHTRYRAMCERLDHARTLKTFSYE